MTDMYLKGVELARLLLRGSYEPPPRDRVPVDALGMVDIDPTTLTVPQAKEIREGYVYGIQSGGVPPRVVT